MNASATGQIGQSAALKPVARNLQAVRSLSSAEKIWAKANAHSGIDSRKQAIPQAIRFTRFRRELAGMAKTHPLHEPMASPLPIFGAADVASPSSVPASNTDAPPPGNVSVATPMLAPGWIAAIDWRAFDEVGLLQSCGAQLDARADLAGRLDGMAECFHRPTQAGKLPLDIAQFERLKLERFSRGVMKSMGYGEQTTAPTDPAFLQTLFERWFLQLAAPQAGDGNGGNIAPFHDELLRLTHPATPHRSQCGDGGDAHAAPSLPRIGALKSQLRLAYLASYRRLDAGPARQWAFEGLCQLFEPTLVRSDLPEAFRYGSLDWTLLSIGIALTGDAHVDLSLHQLISLAAAAGIFAGDPADGALLALRRQAMHAILRMAHAHGKFNLLDLPEIKPAHLETAFDFYQSQLQAERDKLAPMEDLIAQLPTRSDIAKAMLRERGFRDPERRFAFVMPQDLRPQSVWANQILRQSPCMPEGRHALYQIFMMDCLWQLRSDNYLSGPEQDLLNVPQLTHERLSERFEQTFDAQSPRLTREILVPALQERIAFMDADDEQFWRCGEWTVRIPTAWIKTQFAGGPHSAARNGMALAAASSTWIKYAAKNGVLIRLALGTGAQQQIRTYWAALDPFELHRYDGNDALLLASKTKRFFEPAVSGNQLLQLSSRHAPTYEEHTAGNADGDLLQTIGARLLGNRVAGLREAARETTEPEAFRARTRELLLDLLPLYACVKAMQAGERDATSLYCTLDALSMIPVVKAGAGLGKAARIVGGGLTRSQIKNLARLLLQGNVKQAGASQSIATVLRVGPPAVNFSKQGVRLFDPGFELLHGLSALSFRLGKAGLQRLRRAQVFGGMTELQPVMRRLEEGGRQAEKFYPGDGFWHAQAHAIAQHDGGRHIEIGGRYYGVFDLGENKNILALPDGAALRLANPQSALGYGPLLRPGRVSGQLELMPPRSGKAASKESSLAARKEGARVPDALANAAGPCRTKRAGDAYSMICMVPLLPDARFGGHGYAQQYAPELIGTQLSVAEPGGTVLRKVNLLDIGFATSHFNRHTYEWIPEAPTISSYYDPATGHLLGADSTVPFPNAFSGTVVRLSNAARTGIAEYVKIETAYVDAPNDILLTTRYMPFSSYQDIDGALVGQFALGAQRYSFQVDGNRIRDDFHAPVSIYRASNDEFHKLRKYQSLLEFEYDIERINYRAISKLNAMTLPRQEQFEVVMDRAETILRDAVEVLNTQADIARKICARFAVDNEQAATDVMNAVRENLERMLQSFPFFRSQSGNVVGFFRNVRSATGVRQDSFSIPDSMAYQIDFRHMDKALINFRASYFHDTKQIKDSQAGLVLRAYSVASVGTVEMVRGDVAWTSAHAKDLNGVFTLKTLIDVAQELGSPASHALTLEHMTMLLAYTHRSETRASVEAFLNGANFYHRPFSESDFDTTGDGIYDPGPAAPPRG